MFNGVSWKITLDKRKCIWFVLGLFEEKFLLRLPPSPFPFVTYSKTLSLTPSLLFICPRITPRSRSGPKAQDVTWALISTFTILTIQLKSPQCVNFPQKVISKSMVVCGKVIMPTQIILKKGAHR